MEIPKVYEQNKKAMHTNCRKTENMASGDLLAPQSRASSERRRVRDRRRGAGRVGGRRRGAGRVGGGERGAGGGGCGARSALCACSAQPHRLEFPSAMTSSGMPPAGSDLTSVPGPGSSRPIMSLPSPSRMLAPAACFLCHPSASRGPWRWWW